MCQKGSQYPRFLTHNRKYHIILGFRDKSQLLQTVPEPLAEDPSASDRIQALYGLKSFFIFFRIPPDCQAFQTITLRGKKNRNKSYPRTSKCEKLQIPGIGHKDQQHTDSQNDHRCA